MANSIKCDLGQHFLFFCTYSHSKGTAHVNPEEERLSAKPRDVVIASVQQLMRPSDLAQVENSKLDRQLQNKRRQDKKAQSRGQKTLIEQPRKCLRTQDSPPKKPCEQVEKEKRRQEDEVTSSTTPFAQPSERLQSVWKTISDARVDFWRKNTIWPTAEQERTMDCSRDLVQPALATKRSLASRRQQHSDNIDTIPTRTSCDQSLREQKSTPYRHPRYERQLSERGSFMGQYKGGIGAENEMLCKKLLTWTQLQPKDTIFEDNLFTHTLDSIKGRNEARVIRDIAPLITPSAEILAIRGAQHLGILRETINAIWTNAIPFYGPRPQPDYGLGFKREAFTKEQLRKLQPFIGDDLQDCSHFAATYDIYFPFLTSEVKCGASALDIADRQNAHSQTVLLRGLFELFRVVGREEEVLTKINGFPFSHNDLDVRIWGHLLVKEENELKFYREPIATFSFLKTQQTDNRWTGWKLFRNILDIWVTDHFKWICSAIDDLPSGLNFEVSELSKFQ